VPSPCGIPGAPDVAGPSEEAPATGTPMVGRLAPWGCLHAFSDEGLPKAGYCSVLHRDRRRSFEDP
jgi:hypothetical protein